MRVVLLSFVLVISGAALLTSCDAMDSAEGISQNAGEVVGPNLSDTPCAEDAECAGLLEPGGCYVAVCDDTVKACAAIPMPNDTPCTDTSGCGAVEGVCDGGLCLSDALSDCDDGNPCTEDICTTEFGCVYKELEEGAPCDDGEPCSVEDACSAGVCKGEPDLESPECSGESPCGDGECADGETCSTCEADCGPCVEEPKCGDGVCEQLELFTCPEDCEDEPAPTCGDGECSDGESANTCPEDCGDEPPEVADLIQCLSIECAGDFFACVSDPVCAESLECLGTCGSDTNCLQGCISLGGGFSPAQIGLVQCAAGSGCLDLGGGGPGGGGPQCGNDDCEDGENADNCPEDCGGDQFGCGDGECEPWEQWTCPQDCEGPGGSECGNGECEDGENADNCPDDCGEGGGGEFGCGDGECEPWEQWTCPQDCEEPGEAECGNGECEDAETADSCPDDCEGKPPTDDATKECLTDQCELGACLDYPVCTESFECMASCPDSGCAEECIEELSGPGKNVLSGVLECGEGLGCWEKGDTPDPEPEPDPDASLTECLLESCNEQLIECFADDDCAEAYPCLEECVTDGGVECTYSCMPDTENAALLELGQCGGQAGCGNTPGD